MCFSFKILKKLKKIFFFYASSKVFYWIFEKKKFIQEINLIDILSNLKLNIRKLFHKLEHWEPDVSISQSNTKHFTLIWKKLM